MDFKDSPEEAKYRAKVREFLKENAPAWERPQDKEPDDSELLRLARGWQACKCEAGFVGISWKKEVGGQGGSPLEQIIYSQEESRYRVVIEPFLVGMGMCIPTIYTVVDAELASRYVSPAMRGEEIWCQLFSEPAAGLDLAGIRTKAVADGNDWLINDQKVWTSYAHNANFGLLVTRTDPSVAKHASLTIFYIDMHDPAVEVRPIRTLVGRSEFNEVFITDLCVPHSQRRGPVNGGWKVALTTLMHERLSISRPPQAPSYE